MNTWMLTEIVIVAVAGGLGGYWAAGSKLTGGIARHVSIGLFMAGITLVNLAIRSGPGHDLTGVLSGLGFAALITATVLRP